jgi:hypothetical protein
VKEMLDAGYYDMEKLAAGGWLTALKYADELEEDLKKRTGGDDDEFASVPLRRYQKGACAATLVYSADGRSAGRRCECCEWQVRCIASMLAATCASAVA